MKKKIVILISSVLLVCLTQSSVTFGSAETLSDSVLEQIGKIDFSALEGFFNGIKTPEDIDFFSMLFKILNGEYTFSADNILSYFLSSMFSSFLTLLPSLLSIVAISIFGVVVNNVKGSFLSEEIAEIINFICFCAIFVQISASLILIFDTAKNAIENMANFSEIMSPIIITLMVASGGNAGVAMFKPSVSFLSSGIIYIVLSILIPIVIIITILNIINCFSTSVKLDKFSQFFNSCFKWIIGICLTVFTVFMSVQGMGSAIFDGLTFKAAKYAISNGIPIIGGFLRDGFDIVLAGSLLIRNSVGVIGVFILFYAVLTPVLTLLAYNLTLKLISGFVQAIGNEKISNFCDQLSKSITYLIVCILLVFFMFVITILLLIFSVNAYI